MDLEKLKHSQEKINEIALQEIFSELPDSLIRFTTSKLITHCIHEVKSARKSDLSPRVLHNWISQEIIDVDPNDKGKVRRFNRLESIWLNVVTDARKFGVPLESLKQSRKELFNCEIKNFSLLKFCVIDTILRKPKMLIMLEGGQIQHFSLETYYKFVAKGRFPSHLNFNLLEYIELEYPKSNLSLDFNLNNPMDDANKLKLLYLLKTGDFKSIKLYVSNGDVRFIKNAAAFIANENLAKILWDWNFLKAEIILENNVEMEINLRS